MEPTNQQLFAKYEIKATIREIEAILLFVEFPGISKVEEKLNHIYELMEEVCSEQK